MRAPMILMALAACALAGCLDVKDSVSDKAAAPGQEWTMQIAGAGDDNAVFLVTSPDGKTAAARVSGGVSTLIADTEALGLISTSQAALSEDPPPEKVVIAAPGFSLKVSADDTAGAERGRVRINAGGVSVAVDGDDTNGGKGVVRIGGVNEEAALKFINEIDDLSPEVKQQMREKLGL